MNYPKSLTRFGSTVIPVKTQGRCQRRWARVRLVSGLVSGLGLGGCWIWGMTPMAMALLPLPNKTNPPQMAPGRLAQTSTPQPAIAAPSPDLIDRVLGAFVSEVGYPTGELKVKSYEAKTWSDGCLGLASPDETCTQGVVDGWLIAIYEEGNEQTAFKFRTDQEGQAIRLEP